MLIAELALRGLGSVLRALPTAFPGKHRIARRALAWASARGSTATLRGACGIDYRVPSYAEPTVVSLIADGTAEPMTVRALVDLLPRDGVLFGIGANVGAIALPVAQRRADVRVIAFEPCAATYACLAGNIECARRCAF